MDVGAMIEQKTSNAIPLTMQEILQTTRSSRIVDHCGRMQTITPSKLRCMSLYASTFENSKNFENSGPQTERYNGRPEQPASHRPLRRSSSGGALSTLQTCIIFIYFYGIDYISLFLRLDLLTTAP